MMTQPLDYIEYLSKEIGARPAGTEEERQAALYIADEFQKEVGFAASIEEFVSTSNIEGYRSILAMVTIVVSVLAMLFYVLTIPALILALISAVVYALEATGKPVVSRLLARGASQNVVAKYQPHGDTTEEKRGARTRKIVLLAHYDTGKVTPGIVRAVEGTGLPFGTICLVAMVAAAFLLLLRVFVGGTGGAGLLFVNALTIVSIIILAFPIIKTILYRAAPYNEGANNNASGVAALLEVASRINQGSVSEADLAEAENAVIHGEEAALESGVVPDGATLSYEVEPSAYGMDEGVSEEDRLLAAKAAIAALTGQSIEQRVYATASTAREERAARPVGGMDGDAGFDESFDAEAALAPLPTPADAVDVGGSAASDVLEAGFEPEPSPSETGGFENAPSWFVAAQRNAKRSESTEPIQRSRYTSALSAAEQELANRERARAEEERLRREFELRERQEATREALSGAVQGQAQKGSAGFEPEVAAEQPIEFAPIEVESYNDERAPIELEPIEAPEPGEKSTVLPARVGAAQQFGDPGQTVAFVPDHLRALLNEQTVDAAGRVAAELEAREAQELAGDEKAFDANDAVNRAEAEEMAVGQAIEDAEMTEADGVVEVSEAAEAVEDAGVENDITEAFAEAAAEEAAHIDADALPEVNVDQVDGQAPIANRLADLPSIGSEAADETVAETTSPSRSGLIRRLRTDVPSLSGSIGAKREPAKPRMRLTKADLPSLSGVLDPVGSEASTASREADASSAAGEPRKQRARLTKADVPSLSGLIDPISSSDAHDKDAQADSTHAQPDKDAPAVDYDMEIPVSDELAHAAAEAAERNPEASFEGSDTQDAGEANAPEPNEVSMPKSRASGLFKRFRRKSADPLEQSPQEWLDVDDDFEAREAGRARGSWKSFSNGADSAADEERRSGERSWEGGAFSRVRLGRVNMLSGAEESAEETAAEEADVVEDQALNEEIEQIYHFRNPLYDAEIWFVAIGSDTELHDGAKAFIEEHHNELRGAMFVEVESLGVGELCYVAEEGQFRTSKASSRVKRFTRGATDATGIVLGQIKTRSDSVASTIQKAGFQAFHLTGVENGRPSLKGSADDVFENVDELIFEDNVNYLTELLKQS